MDILDELDKPRNETGGDADTHLEKIRRMEEWISYLVELCKGDEGDGRVVRLCTDLLVARRQIEQLRQCAVVMAQEVAFLSVYRPGVAGESAREYGRRKWASYLPAGCAHLFQAMSGAPVSSRGVRGLRDSCTGTGPATT